MHRAPRPRSVLLLLALVAGLLPRAAGASDAEFDPLKKEFPGRVAAEEDPEGRVALVRKVAGFGTEEAARLLVTGLVYLDVRYEGQVRSYELLLKEYEPLKGNIDVLRDNYKARTEIQKRLMAEEDKQRAEAPVFQAFRDAFANIRDPRAVAAAGNQARKERSWRVRALVAEGLGKNEGGTALEVAVRATKDPDGRVRAAALGGMVGRKEPETFDVASALLEKDPDWPVRLAAAGVLASIGTPNILRPLIEALARAEGRMQDDLRDILRKVSGQNFDSDAEQWKRWYLENKADIEGPGPKTALFGAFKATGAGEKKSVYGIETRSRRILFIIDTSGSMKDPLTLDKPKGTATGLTADEEDDRNSTKMEVAKRELKRAIKGLEPGAVFNIISFDTFVVRWQPTMVKADMPTKNQAYAFIRDLKPEGGTWSYGALREAFHIAGMGVSDKAYDPAMDTIYFISDGAPTDDSVDKPQFMEPKVILDAVKQWNPLGRVVVHAVAVDTKAAGGRFVEFMKRLAAENGGLYTQRG